MHRRLSAYSVTLLLLLLALGVTHYLGQSTVGVSDDKKSEFLKSYEPTKAIAQLAVAPYRSEGRGGSAGSKLPWNRQNVSHSLDTRWEIRDPEVDPSLTLDALYEDAIASLSVTGCMITSEERTIGGPFSISYRSGRSVGKLRVERAIATDPAKKLTVTLRLDEEWLVDYKSN